MRFNYNKLRGRIRERLGTENKFCDLMPMNRATLSNKLNNQNEFNQTEIMTAIKVLDIRKEEIGKYFFTEML
mgnify:FL=1